MRTVLKSAAGVGLLALLLAPLSAAAGEYRPQHGSEILWDQYGVAHVEARSVTDLFFGFGWAQTVSHGNLLLQLYAQGRGRAAEYYGAEELASDRWMAVNDVPGRAQQWLRQQDSAMRANLEAFAAGINACAKAHPQDLSEAARRVLPVTAADVIGYAERLFQYTYAAPASLLDKLPPDARQDPPGSNGWAIAPARAAGGHAMLLMNPHLPWAPSWSTYYEIQLRAPGVALYGATQVGLPVLRFVFSDRLGFTHTVNAPQAVTFYRITTEKAGYRFDGRVLPFSIRQVRLKVRQPDGSLKGEAITVRSTVHGPVVAAPDGTPIAMRVAGLDRPHALEQYWQMATAKDFGQFQAALAQVQVPTFNVIYADRDGHIEYLYNGLVPRHATGDLAYWSHTVPGDTSKTLWNDYLTYAELPKVIDPVGGTVENSNDPPWDAAWPQVLDPAPYAATIPQDAVSLRMARGIRMLGESRQISFEQLTSDKWSHRSELADRILPDLLEAVQLYGDAGARRAAEVLTRWDRSTDAASRGALLFLAWVDQPGMPGGTSPQGFARPYDLHHPLTTPAGLADPAGAAQALSRAAREMLSRFGALDVPWGDGMRLRIAGVDLPASGGPGRLGVFDVLDFGAPDQEGRRPAIFGGSFVALVSFEQPVRAKVLLSYGASSQPGSAHRADQLPLLSQGQLRDAWLTREAVEAHLAGRERF